MSEFVGVLINTDGSLQKVEVSTFKDIQAAVGGHFDLVTSSTGETSFWLHDEGKIIGLEANLYATSLLWRLNPAFQGADILCGPVLIGGGCDDEGNTLSINSESLSVLTYFINKIDDEQRDDNLEVLRSVA